MNQIQTRGNVPLNGEIALQGSKNAALPLMAAALLHPGKTVLRHCPRILDVEYMGEILRELGCTVFWEEDALVIDAADVRSTDVPPHYATSLRASVLLLGSLLGRFGRAHLPYPGGCTIGIRPVDLHLQALQKLGAKLLSDRGEICLYTGGNGGAANRLAGCEIEFAFPSVGATENAILAAVCADGRTVLKGCAREPEVVELCRFLNDKGADIRGVGSSFLTISGVEALRDSEYGLMPDRIVAGTYLFAAAATRGNIALHGAEPAHLEVPISVLRQSGVRIEESSGKIQADASDAFLSAISLRTAPYPGFPTDLQSQMLVLLCGANGESRIEETMFESRFLIARELIRMGADIVLEGQCAKIKGPAALRGARVTARELRGGAALVLAGLTARGETVVSGSRFIKRGYENICRDLAALGADIREA